MQLTHGYIIDWNKVKSIEDMKKLFKEIEDKSGKYCFDKVSKENEDIFKFIRKKDMKEVDPKTLKVVKKKKK